MVLPGPSFLFRLIWAVWIVSWIAAAPWSSRTERQLPPRDLWLSHLTIILGAVLLFGGASHLIGLSRLWHVGHVGALALALLTLAGVLFAWWGRLHLGPLWSGSITRKEAHRVVDTGPYGFVRHPIYAGLMAATFATAVADATPAALVGWAAIAFGLWWKARFEEAFLTEELGTAYRAYCRRVPMVVPFGPRAG